jgi:hypothetical protein
LAECFQKAELRMNKDVDIFRLPSSFSFDRTTAAAHTMEPTHTRGVTSFRGLEEVKKLVPAKFADGVVLSFNADGFVADLNNAAAEAGMRDRVDYKRSSKE